MKVLGTHKQALMLIGGCPVDKSESSFRKSFFFISSFTIFTYQVLSATSTVFFILQSISVSLEDTVYALLQVAGLIYILYAIIVAFLMRREINRIFSKLTEIYKKCECHFFRELVRF